MITDMFLTKKAQLAEWMKQTRVFATHEVMAWGVHNFYDRADRTKRDLLAKGIIRKLSDDEKIMRNRMCKDAVYEWVGDGIYTYQKS